MKLPLTWLKEFVAISSAEDVLSKKLTDVGLEVEEVLSDSKGHPILGLNITPNRGDALSIRGLAREVAAFSGKKLIPSKTKPIKLLKKATSGKAGNAQNDIQVKIDSKQCSRYAMAVFKNVKISSSPEWLKHRLDQVGIRSINNIVDITNYILIAFGQPLHAFDLNKIRKSSIHVRTAKEGETLTTLDGQECTLSKDDLIIADTVGPLALAGIMGGIESGITEETTRIALECAYFDPATIRKTARRLGIQTDSSYRFERGVDYNLQEAFFEAVRLIQEVAGAELVGDVVDIGVKSLVSKTITFRPSRVAEVLGGSWKNAEFKKIFLSLGFSVKESKKDSWQVKVPSWRGDIHREEDLFEEILRCAGLERIPATFPQMKSVPMSNQLERHQKMAQEESVKELLTSLEFQEAIHFSFMSPQEILNVDPTLEDQLVHLKNPLGHEFSVMRPLLLPSLLKTLQYHHRHKITQVRFFELRHKYLNTQDGILERKSLAGVLTGMRALADAKNKDSSTDFFEVKGIVEKVAKKYRKNLDFISPREKISFLHPGKQMQIVYQDEAQGIVDLGVLGELHPDIALKLDFKQPVFVFELDWTGFMSLPQMATSFKMYSDQPVVSRDLALLMESDRPAGDLMSLLKQQDPSIRKIKIFDVYEGEKLPLGRKSVAYSLELGLDDRTMTEDEINQVMHKLMNYLKNSFGIEIR